MNITDIAATIKQADKPHRPILIAIEGYGGSGKTTIAEQFKVALQDAYVVNMDDFIVKEKILEPSWDKGGFDRARLEEQVLRPLSKGKPAKYQKLLWATNTLSDFIAIPQSNFVIVEGISSYHPDIAHYYDYKIWIDTPMEIAKERGHARDGSNENAQHWDLWAQNDLAYQEKHHPEQRADFVIANGANNMNNVPFVPNTAKNNQCLQAAILMIYRYFMPSAPKMDWDKFAQQTGYREGSGSWSMAGLLWLMDRGFEVRHIELSDYEALAERGAEYLKEIFGDEIAQYHIKNSDMPAEQKRAKEFMQRVNITKAIPIIDDIKDFVEHGYLVLCFVNSRKLANKPGYVGHWVVIKGFDGQKLIMHDPGLPPMPNRHVAYEDFEKAWADPDENVKALSAIRLQEQTDV